MTNEAEIDLYGDLEDALILPLDKQIEQEKEEERLKEEKQRKLYAELEASKEECKALKLSNYQLQVNMETLLVTVRTDIAR